MANRKMANGISPIKYAPVHLALLLVSLALLPIAPNPRWRPDTLEDPTAHLLGLLMLTIGLPFLVLAATSPLMQVWLSRLRPGNVPYRLYALSNLGSLLALLSYPFLVAPAFGRAAQATLWSAGFGLFALVSGVCAVWLWRANPALADESSAIPAAESAGGGGRTARKRARRAAREERRQMRRPPRP